MIILENGAPELSQYETRRYAITTTMCTHMTFWRSGGAGATMPVIETDNGYKARIPDNLIANYGYIEASATISDGNGSTDVVDTGRIYVRENAIPENYAPDDYESPVYQGLYALIRSMQSRMDAGEFIGETGPVGPQGDPAPADLVVPAVNAYIAEYLRLHPEATIDEDIIRSAVNAWLANHPEATTTVQDGAISAAKLAPAVRENVEAVPGLKQDLNYAIPSYVKECTEGRYVRWDTGATDVGTGWKLIEFPVYEGETFNYNYTRTSPDTRGLAFYNAGGTFISGVQAISTPQEITVPPNAVLCKASFTRELTDVNVVTNVFELKSEIADAKSIGLDAKNSVNILSNGLYRKTKVTNFNTLTGSYIRADGTIGNSSTQNVMYFMCDKNTTFHITTRSQNAGFRLSLATTPPRQNGTTYDVVLAPNQMEANITSDESAVYVCFSVLIAETSINVEKFETEGQYILAGLNPLYAFTNITCIGDSLTHGVVTTDSHGGYRIAKHPYPMVLQRIVGATVEEIAHGGYGATDWWNEYADKITSKTNQLAIVFLGTNDGLTDTVSTDCAGDDYTSYANTNTGNYGKIVAKLKSVGAKIILVQCFTGDGVLANTNKAIKDFADKFGCGLIATKRLLNPAYHYYPDLSGSDSLHFNDLGYSAFAELIMQQISFMDSDYMKHIIPS